MLTRKNYKITEWIRKRGLGCLAVLLIIMQPLSVKAAEGTICHLHTNGCYKEECLDCKDETKVTTHNEDFQCATCGRIASARVVVEWYSCKYMNFEREYKRVAYCYSCGNVVQNQTKSASPNHLRMGQVLACGKTADTVVSKIMMSANTTEWTNDKVVLSVGVTEPAGQSLAPYTFLFSGGSTNGNSCEVIQNGTYSVVVSGKNGQQATVSYEVKNIDKIVPRIDNFSVDKEYPEYEAANLTVTASDGESGLADMAYSFDGGSTYQSANKMKITTNGNYTVMVRDKAGNSSSKTITVKCFATKPIEKPETKPETAPGTETVSKPSNGSLGTVSSENTATEQKDSTTELNEQRKKSESITNLPTNPDINQQEISDEEKEALKRKLEASGMRVELKDIPGIYSSVLRINAEKNAVPTTLNIVSKEVSEAYSNHLQNGENLVKNISIKTENEESNGKVAQVSKAVVGAGVLLCIGMVGFLTVFLVKKH